MLDAQNWKILPNMQISSNASFLLAASSATTCRSSSVLLQRRHRQRSREKRSRRRRARGSWIRSRPRAFRLVPAPRHTHHQVKKNRRGRGSTPVRSPLAVDDRSPRPAPLAFPASAVSWKWRRRRTGAAPERRVLCARRRRKNRKKSRHKEATSVDEVMCVWFSLE